MVPVIFPGGSGARLWPLSSKQYSKQLSPATTGQARQAASINSPATDRRENADNRQIASTGGRRGDKRSD
ncbi:sugar phosphate nucleotidyltransferase [Marinobacterium sedimentorum]|uniref:sugar phosphate nucleotidyltransferase n=1 Tax=Marinobacterium sedimentorum TaxID=2927804 RepID=UPI0034CDA386